MTDCDVDRLSKFTGRVILLMCILGVVCLWLSATVYEQQIEIDNLTTSNTILDEYNSDLYEAIIERNTLADTCIVTLDETNQYVDELVLLVENAHDNYETCTGSIATYETNFNACVERAASLANEADIAYYHLDICRDALSEEFNK